MAEATLEGAPRPSVREIPASKTARQGAERYPSVHKTACGGLFRIAAGLRAEARPDPRQQSDNDTPAQPQPQAMGAARRDPRRGEIPVTRARAVQACRLRLGK